MILDEKTMYLVGLIILAIAFIIVSYYYTRDNP